MENLTKHSSIIENEKREIKSENVQEIKKNKSFIQICREERENTQFILKRTELNRRS